MKWTYKSSIISAIEELNSPDGSSSKAIKQLMLTNLPKGKNWHNGTFTSAIKNLAAGSTIIKIERSHNYKLPPSKHQPRANAKATRSQAAREAAATSARAEAQSTAAAA